MDLVERVQAVQDMLAEAEALDEVRRKGKLVSKMPAVVRHAVAKIHKKTGDLGRSFAIATATLQKAGILKPGSHRLTKKGKRASAKHSGEEDAGKKDKTYERAVKSARRK